MDTKGFVFARRKALSARAVAPKAEWRFTTNAHQDASQSRIRDLIARRVTKSKAIVVEYSLTHLGKTMIAPLGGMCLWAKPYGRNMSAEVRLQETETG
jgi:hypothetical protein